MSNFTSGQVFDDSCCWTTCLRCSYSFLVDGATEDNLLFDMVDRVLKPICPNCGVTDVKQTYPGTVSPLPSEPLEEPLFVKKGDGKVKIKLEDPDAGYEGWSQSYVCEGDLGPKKKKPGFSLKERIAGFVEKTLLKKRKN